MHFGRFVLALTIGSLPVGLLMAWAGELAGSSSMLLLVMTLIPAGLWIGTLLVLGRRSALPEPANRPIAEPEGPAG